MPCDSSYLDPKGREKQLQNAAKLLVFLHKQLGRPIKNWIVKESKEIYCQNEKLVPLLCQTLKDLPEDVRNSIVYNAHNKDARKLADWWEEHIEADEADKEREEREPEEKRRLELKKQALSKLTPEEIKALNIK